MNKPCYVFFDVDDTLIEWTVSWPEAFVRAAAEVGVSVPLELAEDTLAHCLHTIYDDVVRAHAERGDERACWLDYDARVLARLGVEKDLPQAAERVVERLTAPEAKRLFPEVPEVLASLSAAGARLGIVTNRPRAAPDLAALGVLDYFDPVIDVLGTGSTKGDGGVFRVAAAAAADAGLDAWHVGDSYDWDALGARDAGMRSVLLDRSGKHESVDCPRITELGQLLALVMEEEK
ncbi:MAG: HAD-IA family hydrolase [Armatimonadetes bacterium]|nr:HAD-IA family hydrolase [Armatimonadota bacterium]